VIRAHGFKFLLAFQLRTDIRSLTMPTREHHKKKLNNRVITVNRGRCLGGSSSINGMIYIRGNKNDYDNWEKSGCQGWSYNDVLPIFKKLEKDQTGADPKYHSTAGEWPVVMPQE